MNKFKKKIPNKVSILGRTFSIKFKTRKEISEITRTDNPDGAMSFSKKEILISSDLSDEDSFITYLHECHHCISYIVGTSQVTNNERFEIEAESFANGFFDVIKGLKK